MPTGMLFAFSLLLAPTAGSAGQGRDAAVSAVSAAPAAPALSAAASLPLVTSVAAEGEKEDRGDGSVEDGGGDDHYDEGDEPPRRRRRGRSPAAAPDDVYDQAFDKGETLADATYDPTVWFCAGAVSACLGPLPCAVVNGVACLASPDAPMPSADMTPEEAEGFIDGYQDEAGSSRTLAALGGTACAFGIWAGVGLASAVVFGGIAVAGLALGGL